MAEVEYLHVCDTAFSMEGGKPCIIGIFDRIYATAFPASHPVMTFAMRIRSQAHERLSLKIDVARPNGETLVSIPSEINGGPEGSAFLHVNLVNFQFPEAGRYLVKVTSGSRTLVSHSLQVVKSQPPAGQQGAPPERTH